MGPRQEADSCCVTDQRASLMEEHWNGCPLDSLDDRTLSSAVRAVLYCRVSDPAQAKNFSLSTQEKACREYCARHGYEVDRVFVDAGESAKSTDREEFLRLISYCRTNKPRVQALVVYSVNRFARNQDD